MSTLYGTGQRNSLVERYVLLIAELRPAWFVFENVVGLLTHHEGKKLTAAFGAFLIVISIRLYLRAFAA